MQKVLIVNNLIQKHANKPFYDSISLDIERGALIQLIDEPNSNLFEIIANLNKPQAMAMFINGENANDVILGQKISYVQDYENLPNQMTLKNYLSYAANLKSISKSEAESKMVKLIHFFELENVLFWRINKLNIYQKFCTCLFVALLNQPDLILLKLESSSFTEDEIKKIMKFIKMINKEDKTFFISFSGNESGNFAFEFSKKIEIKNGKIVE